VQPDGARRPGILDRYMPDTKRDEVVRMAATECEHKGLYEDAIKLYDLAQLFDNMLNILNKQLSRVLSLPLDHIERKTLVELAAYASARCELTQASVDTKIRTTFRHLRQLVDFFDKFNTGKYNEALVLMKELKLLPFTTSRSELDERLQMFNSLDDTVRRNLAHILLSTMSCLYKLYEQYKSTMPISMTPGGSSADARAREQYLNMLRNEAKAIITFAGMNQYQMPSDTYAKLLHIEVYMM